MQKWFKIAALAACATTLVVSSRVDFAYAPPSNLTRKPDLFVMTASLMPPSDDEARYKGMGVHEIVFRDIFGAPEDISLPEVDVTAVGSEFDLFSRDPNREENFIYYGADKEGREMTVTFYKDETQSIELTLKNGALLDVFIDARKMTCDIILEKENVDGNTISCEHKINFASLQIETVWDMGDGSEPPKTGPILSPDKMKEIYFSASKSCKEVAFVMQDVLSQEQKGKHLNPQLLSPLSVNNFVRQSSPAFMMAKL